MGWRTFFKRTCVCVWEMNLENENEDIKGPRLSPYPYSGSFLITPFAIPTTRVNY